MAELLFQTTLPAHRWSAVGAPGEPEPVRLWPPAEPAPPAAGERVEVRDER